jgi:hypothetical protein
MFMVRIKRLEDALLNSKIFLVPTARDRSLLFNNEEQIQGECFQKSAQCLQHVADCISGQLPYFQDL